MMHLHHENSVYPEPGLTEPVPFLEPQERTMTSYPEIRAAAKAVHKKALGATDASAFDPLRIAKRLGVRTSGRTLIFDSEAIQNAFMDYWTHEYRVNGRTLVESVNPVALGLDALEMEVLLAYRAAQTSFWIPSGLGPREHQVRLQNLLEPHAEEVILTDQALSYSVGRFNTRLAMFLRLPTVRGVTMTSGSILGFNPARAPGLIQGYLHKTRKIAPADLPEARFIFLFRKYQECGEEQAFQDVV
jgi:hypothetical protein